jgi:hypothetical protein
MTNLPMLSNQNRRRFSLVLALALSAGLATLVTAHPTDALPMGTV